MQSRILIADDDLLSRELLAASLRKAGYEVVSVSGGAAAWNVLAQSDAPQLAIIDWMMPDMTGIEVIQAIRAKKPEPYTYVLLLTAKSEKEDVLEGLRAGADDYLPKPFDLSELEARLHVGNRILALEQRLLAAAEQARYQARHDALTSLFNRAAILDVLRRELSRAARDRSDVTVLMIDIDHFKAINDTYGHATGDVALQEVSKRIAAALRPYDSVGRYGGEEFLAVVPGCRRIDAPRLAERVRLSVAADDILVGKVTLRATISIGIATTEATQDPDALVRLADAGLYAAKRGGRNRIEHAAAV